MVGKFRRTLTFPISKGQAAAEKSYQARSTSLPCRFHPFISQLEDEIHALRTWQSRHGSGSAAWICDGLSQLDHLHGSLDDLFQHPQAKDTLCRRSCWTDRLLDDFLFLADAHGCFRSAIVDLKHHQSETQAAIRRNDESRLASSVRSQRKTEKELVKIAAAVRNIRRSLPVHQVIASDWAEVELNGIIKEVTSVVASASASIFAGIASLSAAASALASFWSVSSSCLVVGKRIWRSASFKKRYEEEAGAEEEKWRRSTLRSLEALEECIVALESRSERVFRGLVNTRVFLLNILTPSS